MPSKKKISARRGVMASVVITAVFILLFIVYMDELQIYNLLPNIPADVTTTLCSAWAVSCKDGNDTTQRKKLKYIPWIEKMTPTSANANELNGDIAHNRTTSTVKWIKIKADQMPVGFEKGRAIYTIKDREKLKEKTPFNFNRIGYSSTFRTTNSKFGLMKRRTSTLKAGKSISRTNWTRKKTLSPRDQISSKSNHTASGVPHFHYSKSKAHRIEDAQHKTTHATDIKFRLNPKKNQQQKMLSTDDKNDDSKAASLLSDSFQTRISKNGLEIYDGFDNTSPKTTQQSNQKSTSRSSQISSTDSSDCRTDEQCAQITVLSNKSFLSFPSENPTSKNKLVHDTKKDNRDQYKFQENFMDPHAVSLPKRQATPPALSSKSTELSDQNRNNISLSSVIKSSYPKDKSMKAKRTRYSPKNPRYHFPQTLDFVPTTRHPRILEHLILDGKLWRGRHLMEIFNGAQASSFETDYILLQRHLETGGLNLSRVSREPWPEGAVLPWEMELLTTRPLIDVKSDSSYLKSKVTLLEVKQNYAVGDQTEFRIDVFDGTGKARHQGGDEVRLWVVEKAKQAAVAGRVTDLNNGSYIGDVVLRWPGTVKVRIELTFSKAAIRLHHFFRHVTKCGRFVAAAYFKGHASETTLCSPFPIIPGYNDICNYTDEKYGTGWYCGKPRNTNISCEDWVSIRDMEFAQPFPFTDAEAQLSISLRQQPFFRLIPTDITLNVKKTKTSKKPRLRFCSSRNFSETWDTSKPRGYFFHRKWIRTDCRAPVISIAKLLRCLTNTTLVFTGDSNLLMLFNLLHTITGCTLLEAPSANWHRARSCTLPGVNFHMTWALHGFPAHALADHWAIKGDFQSVTTSLDAIPAHGTFIAVVHLFIHLSMHHYSVFVDQIKGIRRATEALLDRNPDVTVVIRGPHTSYTGWPPILGGDMMGSLFRHLTVRMFEGLHDRVLFLDFWFMTIAGENPQFHPPAYINRAMLGVLFGHLCSHK